MSDKYIESWAMLDGGKITDGEEMSIGLIYGYTMSEVLDMESDVWGYMLEAEIDPPDNAIMALFRMTNIQHEPGQQTFPETGQWDFPPHWEMDCELIGFDTVVNGEVVKAEVRT